MSNKHTRMHARPGEVAVSQTTTDAPLLPVEQIERMAGLVFALVATFIGGRKSAESKK